MGCLAVLSLLLNDYETDMIAKKNTVQVDPLENHHGR